MRFTLNTILASILQALAKQVTPQLHVGSPTYQTCDTCLAFLSAYLTLSHHMRGSIQWNTTHSFYSSLLSKMNSHQPITIKSSDLTNSKNLTNH